MNKVDIVDDPEMLELVEMEIQRILDLMNLMEQTLLLFKVLLWKALKEILFT